MRKFILLLLLVMSMATSAQPMVQQFKLTDVKLLPSRFQQNMQRDSAWIASIPVKSLLHSFRNTAGVFSDKEGGYMTMKHLAGWESMAYLQMKEKADSLVLGLAEVQRQYGTGYLSAFGEGLIDRNIEGKSVWAPFYTLHKILQGLLDQFTMCGNETALTVAKGMGDWAYNKLSPLSEETRLRMIRNEFGGFNEAMYQLYALTKDERYLWVARFFKVPLLSPQGGRIDLGTLHANTLIPKFLGECRNYELGNPQPEGMLLPQGGGREGAESLFWTLVNDHAFVTGEVSDKEHLFKPEAQSKHLTGYDGESCCTYNLLKLADRLFTYQADSKIADYYERALYNHILGQQDPQSSMVCYFTPLMTGGYRLYSTRDSSFWCCVGSGFESHAKYQSSIYFKAPLPSPLGGKSKRGESSPQGGIRGGLQTSPQGGTGGGLYVNLYIPSELKVDGMTVRLETQFPESNEVTLTTTGVVTLKLRYPYWATYMKVNGRKVKPGKDGYVTLHQHPSTTTHHLELGMSLREEATKDDPSRVALLYGPIVLAGQLAPVAHPFSDPKKYNDYYTFDYGKHPDITYSTLKDFRQTSPLHFTGPNGIEVKPFFDLHHHRYVVYWKKK